MPLNLQLASDVFHPFEFRGAVLRKIQPIQTDRLNLGGCRGLRDAEGMKLVLAAGGKTDYEVHFARSLRPRVVDALIANDKKGIIGRA